MRPLGHRRPVHEPPPADRLPTIFIYDGHPGGVGITRTAYGRFEELCGDAHRLIARVPLRARLSLLRAVAEVRQPQRAALHKAGAAALLGAMLGT